MIISLNSINQFIFVMEMCCVFFEIGTESLNIIKMSFYFKRLTQRLVKTRLRLRCFKMQTTIIQSGSFQSFLNHGPVKH
jgi:hypothetical protein